MNKLSDLATLKSGITFNSSEYKDSGIAVIRATDISESNKIIIKEKKFLSSKFAENRYLLTKGDILLTKIGSRIGDCAIFDGNMSAVASKNLLIILPNKIEPSELLERIIKKKDEIKALATGVAMLCISIKSLSELCI